MDLRTDAVSTSIISNGESLPFGLKLKFFNAYSKQQKFTPIKKLVHAIPYLRDAVYTIEEYASFSIQLETETDCEVIVKWSNIQSSLDGDSFQTLVLTKEQPEQIIYRYQPDNPFPWSVDYYHFEVHYLNRKYYGSFYVRPKNVDEDELEWMRELINERLHGLIVDYMRYKKSWNNIGSVKETSFWYLWEWYKTNETKLLSHLAMIESHSIKAISKAYKVQESPRKIDNHSIRWSNTSKGLIHNQSKFLNRRILHINDSEENRNAKRFIMKIQLQLQKIHQMVQAITEELMTRQQMTLNEIALNEQHLKRVTNYSMSTDGIKRRYRNVVYHKKNELIKIKEQRQNYEQMDYQIRKNVNTLKTILSNDFWSSISSKPSQRIMLGNHPSYKILYKIHKEIECMVSNETTKPLQLPVFKKTEVLYEYFVYFSLIDLFISRGFAAANEGVSQQLTTSFYQEGLEDMTTVELQLEDNLVCFVFNEELLTDENEALSRPGHFYTGQVKRKPDIRLDYYKLVDGERLFQSSVIVEVKYRPLRNIYISTSVTEVMEQMEQYLSIRRLNMVGDQLNERDPYNRHPIKFALCLYAGKNHLSGNFVRATCGTFIQYLPETNGEIKNRDIIEDELFNYWIDLPGEES